MRLGGPPNNERPNEWEWDVEGAFNPRYSAWLTDEGVSYGCEIQGPFCGFDSHGKQTWEELFANGPPKDIEMPGWVLDAIRKHGRARNPIGE